MKEAWSKIALTAMMRLHLNSLRLIPKASSRSESSSMSFSATSAALLASAEQLAQSRALSSLIMVRISPFIFVNGSMWSATCIKSARLFSHYVSLTSQIMASIDTIAIKNSAHPLPAIALQWHVVESRQFRALAYKVSHAHQV